MFDEKDRVEKRAAAGLAGQSIEKPLQVLERFDLFVSIEGDAISVPALRVQNLGDRRQSLEVGFPIGSDLELEVTMTVTLDVVFECLGEPVV